MRFPLIYITLPLYPYVHSVLRRALNQALKWGSVTRNVAVLVDPPRVEKHIGWRRSIPWRCCSGYAKARC